MSQTVITTAFEQLKAQQAASGAAVVLDGFIFANVPNLDITSPIDPAEAIPPAAQIVHREDVALTGVVNDNAVVYSVTLGATIGDFDFNWVGLVNKTSNTLAMIVHAPVQNKVANASGVQGNVLTRSFLMEYDGAKKETQITTPAATWQIDFTARLGGMDERQRLENVDIYGDGAFFDDGFLVKRSGNNYSVTTGTGYVGGLRTVLPADQALTVTTKPVKVWVDTCFTGTLTSIWQVQTTITMADTLADYVKNGVQHYVFSVAQINADGSVTDLRKIGSNTDDRLAKHIANQDAHPQYAVKKDVESDLKQKQPLDQTLTNISGKDIAGLLAYLGINETINPSKRVSIGALGTGPFDGSKPAINIGDSDSGFVFESDGVIGVYANSQKIAELTNTEYKIIGNLSLTNGALLLGGLTHFLRHTDADDAGFGGNNVEMGSWNGIGLTCTYDGTTRIYFNTRTGEIGLKGNLKADGNVYSGSNAWLDQTGNLQGPSWGAGVGLKAFLNNTFNKKNTASLDTNGWHRDESTGLIEQWGLIDQANGTYNFPRAFPSQCFVVMVTNTNAQGSGVDNAFGYPISNNQFIAGSKNNNGAIGPYPVAFKALGK